jgi:hypothetical protein
VSRLSGALRYAEYHYQTKQLTTAVAAQYLLLPLFLVTAFKLSPLEKSCRRNHPKIEHSIIYYYHRILFSITSHSGACHDESYLLRCILFIHRTILSAYTRQLTKSTTCPAAITIILHLLMKVVPNKSSLATAVAGRTTNATPRSIPTPLSALSPSTVIAPPATPTYATISTMLTSSNDHHDAEESDDSEFDDEDSHIEPPTHPIVVRALPPMTMLMQQQSIDPTDKTTGWSIIGSGRFEKEQRQIFAHHSQQYLPRNLPLGEVTDYVGVPTTVVIPITVQIRTPQKTHTIGFKNARVLLAIMKLFQSAYPDSYLAPLEGLPGDPKLIHPEHIPFDELTLAKYMVKPVIGPNRVYCTKVIIHSNHTFRDYKINPNFRAYIGEELVVIDHNHLSTATPVNVGFLEQVIPRQDTLLLHHERIGRYLPPGIPPFQMTLQKLYGKDKKWANVIMIQGAEEDVPHLDRLLIKASVLGGFRYFPYSAYTCLIPTRKLTVLNDLGRFHSAYRSVSLPGFKDIGDDICMYTDDAAITDPQTMLLAQTTVSVYLQTHIKSANDDSLFAYVYPPSSTGIREVLCTCANYNDVANGELARVMDSAQLNRYFYIHCKQ